MKVFTSWSGGKDCMLALHRFLKQPGNEAVLVNMCDDDGVRSRSHGIKKELVKIQASCMNLPIIQQQTNFKGYEFGFKKVIAELKEQGVTGGVFGDIYLKEHRVWIDRVCKEMDVEPVFPLWENDTRLLMEEFINEGFKTKVIAVNSKMLSQDWLGRIIDTQFLDEISKLQGIDPCAENGEYHSFVYDGPLFNKSVSFEVGSSYEENGCYFIELN